VTADQIHPKTRAEDYMHDLADGWLVFERTDGEEKRRLCPFPVAWEEGSDEDLRTLCEHADKVPRRSTPSIGMWKVGDAPVPPKLQRDGAPERSAADIPRRPSEQSDIRGDENLTR
jgi:hypothetical protein